MPLCSICTPQLCLLNSFCLVASPDAEPQAFARHSYACTSVSATLLCLSYSVGSPSHHLVVSRGSAPFFAYFTLHCCSIDHCTLYRTVGFEKGTGAFRSMNIACSTFHNPKRKYYSNRNRQHHACKGLVLIILSKLFQLLWFLIWFFTLSCNFIEHGISNLAPWGRSKEY